MAKNLLIVESPAKAKTIEKYLGKDFIVKSSFGHVRDLAKKGLAIDLENHYTPNYEISADKKSLIADLKKSVKEVETVWLATDEDREGEAISWHLYETLKLKNKDTKRITFNEITKPAILKAIQEPREINYELVNAQQARRVLDRLVGFEVSPILWRKVKPSLSAGRVQSVAVRLIVDREKEIENFITESFYKIQGKFFTRDKKDLKAELSENLKDKNEAKKLLEACADADFLVSDVQTKPSTRASSAPFTTSTLQQEASLKLGFSVSKTMLVAQHLYEAGKITYMRTDSVNLSEIAINNAKQEIIAKYGVEYSQPTHYKTKSASAQEAHEAIRPTDFSVHAINGDRDEVRLYELIWKRAIASQMSVAKLERTTIKIHVDKTKYDFLAKGEVIKFDGFLKIYMQSNIEEENEEENGGDIILPKVEVGEILINDSIEATQRFTRPAPRYVEASLVKRMEELGIGRPSTYAPTISTIQKRGYVEKRQSEGTEREYAVLSLKNGIVDEQVKIEITGRDRNKLFPTDIGILVTEFLMEHFAKIMDYNFTAEIEKQFDDIAEGMMEWTKMIDDFYHPFHHNVEDTLETSERVSGERELGVHPVTGEKIIVRLGRFGPMVQMGVEEDDKKPKFASLRKGQLINTITLEEALDLFKLPRDLGEYKDEKVRANVGRFGPYVQVGKKFVSIPKGEDPMDITMERAIELYLAKKEADDNKVIKEFTEDKDIQILNGRYGPYIKKGKSNFRIPKTMEASELTYEEVISIMKQQEKKPAKTKPTKAKKTKK